MQARRRSPTKRNNAVHKLWKLRRPLETLACAHAPPDDGEGMRDAEVLGEELVLGADVVVEEEGGEGGGGGAGGGRCGLAVAEKGDGDDEVFFGGECFVVAYEPEILG